MCLGFFATFLKKGSAKNFFSKKVLGCFSKKVRSTVVVNRRAFFILSGYAVTILIPLRPSLPVGAYRPSLAVGTADHCRHLIRHLSVTPSPTGEGNCKRASNNRFFMKLLTEEWVKLAFSCERRGTASAVDE